MQTSRMKDRRRKRPGRHGAERVGSMAEEEVRTYGSRTGHGVRRKARRPSREGNEGDTPHVVTDYFSLLAAGFDNNSTIYTEEGQIFWVNAWFSPKEYGISCVLFT